MNVWLPAEWEKQDAVLLGWPHENTDWKDCLEEVIPVFIEIAKTISQYEKVIIPTPNPSLAKNLLIQNQVDLNQVILYPIQTNDTWARDYGFITLFENNKPVLLDFGFNGWGLKFPSCFDNQINCNLSQQREFQNQIFKTMGLILEGGSIESDGQGLILTTTECLMSRNRNPHLTQNQIEQELKTIFNAQKILWLDHGYLAGDDTDSHIDTLARLCPNDVILFVSCEDPKDEHYQELKLMKEQLGSFKTLEGKPFKLIALPFPSAKFDAEGKRMPATYANFLIINNAVLVPIYQDEHDEEALKIFQEVFPDRKIIGIDCLPVIQQHGSLHCLTMQIPKGVLS